MASDIELKKEYLKLYHPRIKRGDKTVPTYAQWLQRRKTPGSSQTKKQISGLSSGDYAEIQKKFGKSKYQRSKGK